MLATARSVAAIGDKKSILAAADDQTRPASGERQTPETPEKHMSHRARRTVGGWRRPAISSIASGDAVLKSNIP